MAEGYVMAQEELDEFRNRVELLGKKGYTLGYEVTNIEEGKFLVKYIGEHDFEETARIDAGE